MLLNACMDVAKALSGLIDSTKDACGKNSEDDTMDNLKSSAKEMVQSVRYCFYFLITIKLRPAPPDLPQISIPSFIVLTIC